MKPINFYINTVFFLLVFLNASMRFERNRERLSSFFQEKYSMEPNDIRRSWNTIINVLWLWATFLLCKKLLYYLPLVGVMQTRFSIWWIEKHVMEFLLHMLIFYLLLEIVIGFYKISKKSTGCLVLSIFSFLSMIWILYALSLIKDRTLGQSLGIIVFSLPLLLKMVLSGKYLGLLTGFLMAVFINRYKKSWPKFTPRSLLASLFLFALIVFLVSFVFTGDAKDIIQGKVDRAKSEADFSELLDAADSINIPRIKSICYQSLSAAKARSGEKKEAKNLLAKALTAAERIDDVFGPSDILLEISAAAAALGDIQWAESIARKIFDPLTKEKAFEKNSKFKDNK